VKKEKREDVLLKLSMPGKTLREETKQKTQENEQASQRPGIVPEESKEAQQPSEDLLTKITMPGKEAVSNEPQPIQENIPANTGLSIDADVDEIKRLAETIFNSDYKEKKKK